MKAICIDNENVSQWVTVGKWYDIIEDNSNGFEIKGNIYAGTSTEQTTKHLSQGKDFYVLVKNESGWKLIDRKHFRTESELREEKLKKLGI